MRGQRPLEGSWSPGGQAHVRPESSRRAYRRRAPGRRRLPPQGSASSLRTETAGQGQRGGRGGRHNAPACRWQHLNTGPRLSACRGSCDATGRLFPSVLLTISAAKRLKGRRKSGASAAGAYRLCKGWPPSCSSSLLLLRCSPADANEAVISYRSISTATVHACRKDSRQTQEIIGTYSKGRVV